MEAQPDNSITAKFSTEGLPRVIAKKIKGLVEVLNQDKINMKKLRVLLGEGIPDEATRVRQYSWKLILGYLPQEKSKWQEKVEKQDKTYREFIDMFLPTERFPDHPIQLNKNHQLFSQLEEDFYLWETIEKDTSRTHAELSFFCTPAPEIMIPFLTSPRRQKFKLIYGENQEEYKGFMASKEQQRKTYRYDYMTRILYIYARLNPKIQYVQGMNEILAPIFYLVNGGKSSASSLEQSSCFFMFNNAISDILELHIKDLDKSENGIHGKLNQVNQMLVVIQPLVWNRLEELKIDPFFYCFRWMTLLFAQDFLLFDTLRIWQSIFSADNRLDFMNYFAISIIISKKQFILENDFVAVLEHLQRVSDSVDLTEALIIANQLYYEFKGHDFKQQSILTKQALSNPPKKQKRNWAKSVNSFLRKMI